MLGAPAPTGAGTSLRARRPAACSAGLRVPPGRSDIGTPGSEPNRVAQTSLDGATTSLIDRSCRSHLVRLGDGTNPFPERRATAPLGPATGNWCDQLLAGLTALAQFQLLSTPGISVRHSKTNRRSVTFPAAVSLLTVLDFPANFSAPVFVVSVVSVCLALVPLFTR